jgi:hypothetical protein
MMGIALVDEVKMIDHFHVELTKPAGSKGIRDSDNP